MQSSRHVRIIRDQGVAHHTSALYGKRDETPALVARRKPRRLVLKSDPDYDPDEGALMEFRLTYAGKLHGSSTKSPRARHKQQIRKIFHKQLKRLWEKTPQLNGSGMSSVVMLYGDEKFDEEHPHHTIEKLSENFEMFGYKFVPLVTRQISLLCGLEILFLRPDPPGGALRSGDIDNRIKTLFDALRLPRSKQELKDYPDPEEDEKPFFCLLEDDCLITKITVETDMLFGAT